MSNFEVDNLTPELIIGLINRDALDIKYNKYPRKNDNSISGAVYFTMLINYGKLRQFKMTIGPTLVTKGPWAERKYINSDLQIGINTKAGEALYALSKHFEKAYNVGALNIGNKKPRTLTLPIYEGKDDEKVDPKVKIALGFNENNSARFKCFRYIMSGNELKKEDLKCDSKNCADIIKYGNLISGDIIVTYNNHPSRGLTLCFEARELIIKQVAKKKISIADRLTEEEKRMMVDNEDEKVVENNENDTIEDQLNRLELDE